MDGGGLKMVTDATKFLISQWCKGNIITFEDIDKALITTYEEGVRNGIKITNDNYALIQKAIKKGS